MDIHGCVCAWVSKGGGVCMDVERMRVGVEGGGACACLSRVCVCRYRGGECV